MVSREIEMSSLRRERYKKGGNHILRRHELDLLKEKRDAVQLQICCISTSHNKILQFTSETMEIPSRGSGLSKSVTK